MTATAAAPLSETNHGKEHNDTSVIFSCDEKFMPLAKGLVLSLREATDFASIFCIDIGLSETSRAWLRQQGVVPVRFSWEQLFHTHKAWRGDQYRLAQFVRPLLPRVIEGFDYYVWLDADTWVQDSSAIRMLRSAVAENESVDIALVPQVDFSYRVFRDQWGGPVEWAGWWYKQLYGETIAREFCNKAILNSGVFCMRGGSPIWRAWENEIRAALKKKVSDRLVLHLAEQTCLNYVSYSYDKFIIIDPIYNYTLHDGCARRAEDGRVVIAYPPYRPIAIVHLTSSSKFMQKYLDDGLLFDFGTYLTDEERRVLLALEHY